MSQARRKYGGDTSAWAFTYASDGTVVRAAGAVVRFYTALTGGTQVTDLQTAGGVATTTITTDSNGEIPEFLGTPIGATGDYRLAADANAGSGPRRWLTPTDLGSGLAPDILDYGADKSGGADSTQAFLDARADAKTKGGLRLRVPEGTYKVNAGKIPVTSFLWLDGAGYGATTINFTYTGSGAGYLFDCDPTDYSQSNHVEGFRITGLKISAAGGDIFWGANLVRSQITDNYLITDATHSIMNVRDTTGGNSIAGVGSTYLAECLFRNRESNTGTTQSTENWHLDFSGAGMRGNDNIWDAGGNKIWTYPGAYWLRLIGDATVLGSKRNTWRDLIFECSPGCGGLIWLQNTSEADLRNISSEDLSAGTLSNPMLKLNAFSTGPGCHGVKIDHYSRRSGSNISNTLPDILLDSNCSGITIDSPSHSSGGTNLTVDFGGATNCVRSGAWYEQGGSPVLLNTAGVNAYV